jgi:hypothetical protein
MFLAGAGGLAIVLASPLASLAAVSMDTPDPVSTSISVTVTIPGPTPTPSSSAPGGSGGGGGGTGTGSGSGGTHSGAPTIPSGPSSSAQKLILDHDRIHAGDTLVATGMGFTKGEKVQFVMYPGADVIGQYVTDSAGTVIASFTTSTNLHPGDHVVEATGWKSGKVANASFIVDEGVGSGSSNFPWIVWLIAAGVLIVGIAFLWIGMASGWLPTPFGKRAPDRGVVG